MLELVRLRLRNYQLFREQDFTFNKGLTVIGGNNRVGKTLLLAPIRPLLFDLPSGEHMPKGSHVELDLRKRSIDGKAINLTIGADSPKAKPDWSLRVNSQDMHTHRKRDVRSMITERISITEDLFDSTCHIAGGGHNLPLFAGTPAARMDWLTSAFNLAATYNKMQDEVSEMLDRLNKDEIRLQVLRQQLIEEPELPDEDALAKRQERHAHLKQQIAEWTGLKARQQQLKELLGLQKALQKRITKYTQRDELMERIALVEDKIANASKSEQERDEYAVDLKLWKLAQANRDKLIEMLPEKWGPYSPKKITWLLVRLDRQLKEDHKLRNEADDRNTHWEARIEARRLLKRMTEPKYSAKQANELLAQAKDDASFANRMLRTADTRKDDGTCAECGTPLTKKHRHNISQHYIDRREKAKETIYTAESAISYWDMLELARAKVKPVDVAAVQKRIQANEERVEALEQLYETASVQKPDKPKDVVVDLDKLRSHLGDLMADKALFVAHGRSSFPSRDKLKAQIAELREEIGDKADVDISELSEKAFTLGERNHRDEMLQRRHRDAAARNAELHDEIQALQKRVRSIRPLKVLKEAFGRSGIMLNSMNDMIQHLLQELNALAPLLLNEKFRVDIVTGPRKLNVMVERNGSVGSIRSLSTSEQRCWSLLFATAMLRILPNNMLTDTIILDELEANMDATSRKRYGAEFLPYLQTIVPKVIVVTPLISGELILQPDHAYRVEKHNNISTLRAI